MFHFHLMQTLNKACQLQSMSSFIRCKYSAFYASQMSDLRHVSDNELQDIELERRAVVPCIWELLFSR